MGATRHGGAGSARDFGLSDQFWHFSQYFDLHLTVAPTLSIIDKAMCTSGSNYYLRPSDLELMRQVQVSIRSLLGEKTKPIWDTLQRHCDTRSGLMMHIEALAESTALLRAKFVQALIRQVMREMHLAALPSKNHYEAILSWLTVLQAKAVLFSEDYADVVTFEFGIKTSTRAEFNDDLRACFFEGFKATKVWVGELSEFTAKLSKLLPQEKTGWLLQAGFYGEWPEDVDELKRWFMAPEPEALCVLEEQCLQMQGQLDREFKHIRTIDEKIDRASERVVAPLLDLVEKNRGFDCLLGRILMNVIGAKLMFYVHFKREAFPLLERYKKLLPRKFQIDTYIGFQLYINEKSLSFESLRQSFIRLIESPKKFNRWDCAQDQQVAKAHIKVLTKITEGDIKYPLERNHLLSRLRSNDLTHAEMISLVSEYLELVSEGRDYNGRICVDLGEIGRRTSERADVWHTQIEAEEKKYHLKRKEDYELERLIEQEEAESLRTANEIAAWRSDWEKYAHNDGRGSPDEIDTCQGTNGRPAAADHVNIVYVENLGAEMWRQHPIACRRVEFTQRLRDKMEELSVETIVPISSVARAIEHFLFGMDAQQRTLLQMERIAGEPWRKLKRGAQRIYLLEKNGTTYIHLMKRKDWVKACVKESRYTSSAS